MGILTKTSSIALSGQCSKHSKLASNAASKSNTMAQRARREKDIDKKIDYIAESLEQLSKAILEVSDSITPISRMIALNELFSQNLEKLLKEKS